MDGLTMLRLKLVAVLGVLGMVLPPPALASLTVVGLTGCALALVLGTLVRAREVVSYALGLGVALLVVYATLPALAVLLSSTVGGIPVRGWAFLVLAGVAFWTLFAWGGRGRGLAGERTWRPRAATPAALVDPEPPLPRRFDFDGAGAVNENGGRSEDELGLFAGGDRGGRH